MSFKYPHPTVAHWVRRMTLNLDMMNLDPGHIRNGYRDSDWVCLMGAQSNWQSFFKLEKLDVTVSPFPDDCPENRVQSFGRNAGASSVRRHLNNLFQDTKVDVRAATV
jgi:hypothetical protein